MPIHAVWHCGSLSDMSWNLEYIYIHIYMRSFFLIYLFWHLFRHLSEIPHGICWGPGVVSNCIRKEGKEGKEEEGRKAAPLLKSKDPHRPQLTQPGCLKWLQISGHLEDGHPEVEARLHWQCQSVAGCAAPRWQLNSRRCLFAGASGSSERRRSAMASASHGDTATCGWSVAFVEASWNLVLTRLEENFQACVPMTANAIRLTIKDFGHLPTKDPRMNRSNTQSNIRKVA